MECICDMLDRDIFMISDKIVIVTLFSYCIGIYILYYIYKLI